jgi:outer membrane protein OmpA-like peptidoglycan-associated protein
MSKKLERPAVLAIAGKARWWPVTDCAEAAPAGRYVGPVFQIDGLLVQRVATGRVVIHELAGMDFGSSETLSLCAATGHLNDLILSIYCVNGARTAYLRTLRAAPWQTCEPSPAMKMASRRPGRAAVRGRGSAFVTVTVAAVAATLALAACASKNKLVTPDGKDRVAVNTPESLGRYQDLVARQDAMTLEKSELQLKYELLNQQVQRLKNVILEQQRKDGQGAPQAMPSPKGPQSEQPASQPENPSASPTGKGTVVVGSNSVVFRVNHDVGHTAFTPTATLADEIVKAARAAKMVVIRGRTDSATVDEVETRIALERAVRARQYLLSNGIEPAKMHVWYRAAGDFIADNSTPEGRAVNRRVEIEARGLETSAIVSEEPDSRIGRNQ